MLHSSVFLCCIFAAKVFGQVASLVQENEARAQIHEKVSAGECCPDSAASLSTAGKVKESKGVGGSRCSACAGYWEADFVLLLSGFGALFQEVSETRQ